MIWRKGNSHFHGESLETPYSDSKVGSPRVLVIKDLKQM